MRIHLKKDTTIEDVKKEFNEAFPNLKLEFFKVPHQEETVSKAEYMYDDDSLSLEEIGKIVGEGVHVDADGADSVWDFEKRFADVAMLYVQVFRKGHNGVWLLTSATDDWTLQKQNRKGALSAADKDDEEAQSDFREQP